MLNLASVIITYKRVLDAKIQMEIQKSIWTRSGYIENIDIYHVYNGQKKWYRRPYLESEFVTCPNPGHYLGAALMLDSGVNKALASKNRYDFILISSADVWITNPDYISTVLKTMTRLGKSIGASLWYSPLLIGTEFLILTPDEARHIFPLDIKVFSQKHKTIYKLSQPPVRFPLVEICLTSKLLTPSPVIPRYNHIYFLPGRKIVLPTQHFYSPHIPYLSHHNLLVKQEALHRHLNPKLISDSTVCLKKFYYEKINPGEHMTKNHPPPQS